MDAVACTSVDNYSCQLILASMGRVPIIEIGVTLKCLHCLLHCGLYGMVHNFLVLEISHSSPMPSLRIFSGKP